MEPIRSYLYVMVTVIGLTSVSSVHSYGQESYFIDTLYPVHNLDPHLSVIEDTTKELTIEDLRNDTSLVFKDLKSFLIKPKRRRSPYLNYKYAYWARINLSTNGNLKGWMMHFQDNHISNNAWLKGNGKVDVYTFIDDKLYFHKKSGTSYTESQKEVNDYWNQNKIYFEIPQGKTIETYIRIEGNKTGTYPAFNLTIRNPSFQDYHPYVEKTTFLNTFMMGVSFIIFFYFMLRYFYTKEKVFLGFCLWVLLVMLTFSMIVNWSAEYLLKYMTGYRFPIWVAVSHSVFFGFWFFGLGYVKTRDKYPKLDLAIKIYLAIVILEGVIMTTLAALGISVKYASVSFHYANISLFSFIGAGLSIFLLSKKDNYARYFGAAALIGNVGFIIAGFWAAGIIRFALDPFAITFFLLILGFSFALGYRQQQISVENEKQKLSAQRSEMEVNRIKDLDEMKTRFFANISHEFRTPLSLITGPLEMALKKSNKNGSTQDHIQLSKKSYGIIKKNTDRLLSLVDQLLDLSKLESGHVHLNLVQGGIIKFLKSIVYSFESMAERNNISLNTSFPKDLPQAYFDKDKLEKIVANFLSNALKYTPKGGSISFSFNPNGDYYVIEISDTGKGIQQKDLTRIFDRFYRIEGSEDKGSGIGLALAKELIDLHHGQVSVDSTIGEGTTFKIKIPYTLKSLPDEIAIVPEIAVTSIIEEPRADDKVDLLKTEVTSETPITTNSVVLIVEDNSDLQDYISDVLKEKYQIIKANDGMHGERMAIEHIPDLIISDIMMPKKDGYEMCHDLKSNQKTSHIPIIMLTAKAGQHNKMEGLTQGADAYLTKPFDGDELLVRVFNLIESRKKLWKHFTDSGLSISSDIPMDSMDDLFFNGVIKAIKDNLDNEQFSVEDLSREVGFSRSQLHRKLKALINKSANQLIVEIRLNEARRMLENKVGTVSEVAFSVGYSSLPYFTRSFKKQFGVLPSKV